MPVPVPPDGLLHPRAKGRRNAWNQLEHRLLDKDGPPPFGKIPRALKLPASLGPERDHARTLRQVVVLAGLTHQLPHGLGSLDLVLCRKLLHAHDEVRQSAGIRIVVEHGLEVEEGLVRAERKQRLSVGPGDVVLWVVCRGMILGVTRATDRCSHGLLVAPLALELRGLDVLAIKVVIAGQGAAMVWPKTSLEGLFGPRRNLGEEVPDALEHVLALRAHMPLLRVLREAGRKLPVCEGREGL